MNQCELDCLGAVPYFCDHINYMAMNRNDYEVPETEVLVLMQEMNFCTTGGSGGAGGGNQGGGGDSDDDDG